MSAVPHAFFLSARGWGRGDFFFSVFREKIFLLFMLETNFEQCAMASGLITKAQLESVWKEMLAREGNEFPPEEIPAKLAEILVDRQLLNEWQTQQLLAGRRRFTLGLYKMFDSIGQGGMGQVFKARHTVLNRVVAVKVLPLSKSTPTAIENFQREIQALASLDHENLVKAIDAGKDASVYYLVCEYVPGPDLRKLIRRQGPLSEESAASIIVQVAAGLQHAHDSGLVHRDIKPGNILVAMDGIAKLSDLGLASPRNADTEQDPKQVKIVGTADYISPDHIKSPGAPKPIWDIYSLGCSLYYAVTGKVPYPGGTSMEKVKAHCDTQTHPLDPQRLNPMLSDAFVEVLGDMMAKDPADRIPTANEVIRRLRPWSDGTPRPLIMSDSESSLSISVEKNEMQGFFVPASLVLTTPVGGGVPQSRHDAHVSPPAFPSGAGEVMGKGLKTAPGQTPSSTPPSQAAPPSVSPGIAVPPPLPAAGGMLSRNSDKQGIPAPESAWEKDAAGRSAICAGEGGPGRRSGNVMTSRPPIPPPPPPPQSHQLTPPSLPGQDEALSNEDMGKLFVRVLVFFVGLPLFLILLIFLLWLILGQ